MDDGYQDDRLRIDDEGVTIASFRWPGDRRTIRHRDIDQATLVELGRSFGRWRVVGVDLRRPRHFFTWDTGRRTKSTGIVLDTGRTFKTVITPDDPTRALDALRSPGRLVGDPQH